MKPIPFLTPRFPDPALVARDYAEIVASGIFSNGGPREHAFAEALATWIGHDVAVSVTSSATASIQLACRALFRRDRREVLVASFTAVAPPSALRWCGYEPVFVDIDPRSWHPDPNLAERFLEREGERVAGILLTNTFGTANDAIDRWEALAGTYELPLIVDSAPGFGSRYSWGEPLGARGDCEIFSFHATKTVAVGEGGAIASRDRALIERFDRLKNFGFDDARRSLELGTNAKLPELASAMGLRQIEALADRLARRREVLGWFVDGLGPLGFEFQPGLERSAPPFFSAALPPALGREVLGRALARAQIGWRAYYSPPVHRHRSFAGVRAAGPLDVTDDLAARIVSLPLDDALTADELERVIDVAREAIAV